MRYIVLGAVVALILVVQTWAQEKPDTALDSQLEEAMRVGRPVAGLDVTIATNRLQLNRAEYRVPVMVRIAPASDLATGSRMDVMAIVTDRFQTTVLRLRDQLEVDAAQANGQTATPLAYAATFTLLPGAYTVRFVVRNQSTGGIGTADASFVISNLARSAQQP